MTAHGLIFSAPMVRALLAGTKTQTRRLAWLETPHSGGYTHAAIRSLEAGGGGKGFKRADGRWEWHKPAAVQRFKPGDLVYVREAWRTESKAYDDLAPSDMDADYPVIYEADADWSANKTVGRLRSSMHLPRWASRLTLAVTATRIERVQDITEADAQAEGIDTCTTMATGRASTVWWDYLSPQTGYQDTPRGSYRTLWCALHGEASWRANPEVVVLTFEVHKANIDTFKAKAAA